MPVVLMLILVGPLQALALLMALGIAANAFFLVVVFTRQSTGIERVPAVERLMAPLRQGSSAFQAHPARWRAALLLSIIALSVTLGLTLVHAYR